jgi:hypothetical protein
VAVENLESDPVDQHGARRPCRRAGEHR